MRIKPKTIADYLAGLNTDKRAALESLRRVDRAVAPKTEERLHHLAHEQCFIANSIKTAVTVSGAKHDA
jgi:organic hydroperoxide reductase OsmC/OhrA